MEEHRFEHSFTSFQIAVSPGQQAKADYFFIAQDAAWHDGGGVI
jgi:hypothetical protein